MRKSRKISGNPLKSFHDVATREVSVTGITSENFETRLSHALNSYHQIYNVKDCRKIVIDYFGKKSLCAEKVNMMDENTMFNFMTFSLTLKFLMDSNLSPDITEDNKKYFEENKKEIELFEKKKLSSERIDERGQHIQKAITQKAFEYAPTIDEYLDKFLFENKREEFDVIEYLKSSGLSNLHAKKLFNSYERQKQEYIDIETDKELQEAYRHLTKKRVKDIIDFYDALLCDIDTFCDLINQRKRQERKPKKQSVEKIISSVKYLKESDEFNICSLNPSKILDKKIALIFNAKYKKLTILESGEEGLSIKGTTINGFDPTKSKTKILRNPQIFLNKLKDAKKTEIRKIWKEIRTKETEANGRLSAVSLIINVF